MTKEGEKQRHKVAVDALSVVARCAVVIKSAGRAEDSALLEAAKDVWEVVVESSLPCDVRAKALEVVGEVLSCVVANRELLKERYELEKKRKQEERNDKNASTWRGVRKAVSVVVCVAICVALAVSGQGVCAIVALAFALRALGDSLPLRTWLKATRKRATEKTLRKSCN